MSDKELQEIKEKHRTGSGMTFGGALACLKAGKYVARKAWHRKGKYLMLNGVSNGHIPGNMITLDGKNHWNPDSEDLLAEDWFHVVFDFVE